MKFSFLFSQIGTQLQRAILCGNIMQSVELFCSEVGFAAVAVVIVAKCWSGIKQFVLDERVWRMQMPVFFTFLPNNVFLTLHIAHVAV